MAVYLGDKFNKNKKAVEAFSEVSREYFNHWYNVTFQISD